MLRVLMELVFAVSYTNNSNVTERDGVQMHFTISHIRPGKEERA